MSETKQAANQETAVEAAPDRAGTDAAQQVSTPEVPAAVTTETPITIVLNTVFTTNGVKHGPGRVTVGEGLAEDLLRRQEAWDKVEKFRQTGGDYTVKEALASFDAAGK